MLRNTGVRSVLLIACIQPGLAFLCLQPILLWCRWIDCHKAEVHQLCLQTNMAGAVHMGNGCTFSPVTVTLPCTTGCSCVSCAACRPSPHTAVTCSGSPAKPPNGNFSCPSPAAVGTVCKATCNSGYTGSPTATCTSAGTYSTVTGQCIRELMVAH